MSPQDAIATLEQAIADFETAMPGAYVIGTAWLPRAAFDSFEGERKVSEHGSLHNTRPGRYNAPARYGVALAHDPKDEQAVVA